MDNKDKSPISDAKNKNAEVEIVQDNKSKINIKDSFKDSIFLEGEIETMEKKFLSVSDYLSLTWKVFKRNAWSAFFRPAIFSILPWVFFGGVAMITSLTLLGSNDQALLGSLVISVAGIIAMLVSINFSVRSYLILKDPKHDFLSYKYKIMGVLFSFFGVLISTNLFASGLGIFESIPYIGFIFTIAISFFVSLFLSNAVYMVIFEENNVINNIYKSIELSYNRLKELAIRHIVLILIQAGMLVIVGLLAGIIFAGALISTPDGVLAFEGELFTVNSNSISDFSTPLAIISVGLIFVIAASILTNAIYRAFEFVNYTNLRLSPKPNKSEEYYNNYKPKIPRYVFFVIIAICMFTSQYGMGTSISF